MILTVPALCGLDVIEDLLADIGDSTGAGLTVIVPPGVVHVHPVVICVLAAEAARVREAGEAVVLVGEIEKGSYLDQMGLRQHLTGVEHGSGSFTDPTGRFISISQVVDNSSLNTFVSDFVPILHAPPQTALAFSYVLSELIRNVLEHSGSPSGAFVAAELDEDGTIRLGVVDAGIGVPASIRRSHRAETDPEAISLAFSPGVSGTSSSFGGGERNGGAGLFFMKSIALLSGRMLMMYTQQTLMRLEPQVSVANVTASLDDDEVAWREFPWPFTGTAVGIDLEIGDGILYDELFGQIRSAYHLSVKTRVKSHKKARFT
jgi:anti-sigma regulatory factor (Ser/Thr protein kinase)